ncbi:MAG: Sialic acid TRAP transporter permease protein SiaT [Syntrophorhabdaceae bacterium PtaU1.Bin034]|jgi:C4-dicarboxylate transporter DctM subunit|nr:MAG: Sialic acid TRAP transporter permease protein SiaT [Syntrophorhabdaceae bacterium PtaU1.Bin034]
MADIQTNDSTAKRSIIVRLLDVLFVACGWMGSILIPTAALCITYEVIMRYLFNSPTVWVSEVTIYLVMAATFLSLAFAMKEKAHVNVDFIINKLSGKSLLNLKLLGLFLGLLYSGILVYQGSSWVYDAYKNWELAGMILKVPKFIPEFFIPFGSALLFIRLLIESKDTLARLFNPSLSGVLRPGAGGIPSFVSSTKITVFFVAILLAGIILLQGHTHLGLALLFFGLLFCGTPVAFALGLFGVFGFVFLYGGSSMLVRLPIVAYSTMDSTVQVALPLFILTSSVLRYGDVGGRIYRFANVLVRHLPGGLGVASVIFCGLFAAMTGSSVAVAATVSLIALPEMLSRGYDKKLCIGLLAAGGTLGILFPPSLPLMLYASMTNESMGDLFMGTLIPGIILSLGFCVFMMIVGARNKNIAREKRAGFREILEATKVASGGLVTILIIIGGIYSGVFTPTESGGVAAIYTILLCAFIYRTLTLKKLVQALMDTMRFTAMIMFIIIGANITGQVIALSQIPQDILSFVASSGFPKWAVIICINIFLIFMGGPLEAVTILVITLPILYPLVTGLGFSGIWFAVIMVINMELALISPPEGLNLFVLQDLAKATAAEVTRGVIPFLVIIALFLILIALFPQLTMWLPTVLKPG